MQVRPGAYAHRSVTSVLARVLRRGLGPGARICALHLRSMATRPPSVGRWTSEARIGVEAASRSQTDKNLARNSLKSLLHLDGIVASVEDEQGNGPLPLSREAQKRFDLLGGHLALASCAGRTRSTSMGAVQLAGKKLSCERNWKAQPATIGCPAEWREG